MHLPLHLSEKRMAATYFLPSHATPWDLAHTSAILNCPWLLTAVTHSKTLLNTTTATTKEPRATTSVSSSPPSIVNLFDFFQYFEGASTASSSMRACAASATQDSSKGSLQCNLELRLFPFFSSLTLKGFSVKRYVEVWPFLRNCSTQVRNTGEFRNVDCSCLLN